MCLVSQELEKMLPLPQLSELLCPKFPKLELVFYSSASSPFDCGTETHPHITWRYALESLHMPSVASTPWRKYRGPAQAGSPRSHWENKLDSEQNGCFLSAISFSCTKEGIPDLPGGTTAVILKGGSLDQQHQLYLRICSVQIIGPTPRICI